MTQLLVPPWQQPGKWVMCGITGMGFPAEAKPVMFRGRMLYLIPGKPAPAGDKFGDLYPVVALEHSGMTFEDGQRLISAFINSVAWVRRAGIRTAQFGGGSRVYGLGGQDAKALVDDKFELDYVPEPTNDKARLALGFYREGLTLNSVAYQCLSLFKILNIVLGNGPKQIAWINANIADARKLNAWATREWEKVAGFDPTKVTAGEYLYVSNRCAIAHANNDPLIDPDDPDDRQRLENDYPMVTALAQHFIEKEFGIKSAQTVWREHLYELQGFGDAFGPALVTRIKAREEVPLADFQTVLPELSLRLAFNPEFPSLENMSVDLVDCHDGKVNLSLNSKAGCTTALLVLDFAEERLDFEVFEHLAAEDDGSLAGARAELDRLRFTDRYLGNGKLEVWSRAERLARKDAFIPMNVDLGATHRLYERSIAAAEAKVKERLTR